MKRIALVLVLGLIVSACGDDEAATTTTAAPATTVVTTVTTTTTTLAITTTAEPATTRTSFENPPATAPNPERGPFVGIWRWPNTHTRYMQLFEHGVIGTGDIYEDALSLTRLGEWDVTDGVMTITLLELGFVPCGDAIGTYAIRISGQNLVMEVIDDACEDRAVWLIGADRTTRTWIPDDAEAP